jgi:hypothetical protein
MTTGTDTSADSAALSDDSNATQADISGVGSPTPTSDAASAAAGSDPDTSPIRQGIRHRPDRTPLLALSRCLDDTGAGRLSPDLFGTPLLSFHHVGTFVHVIDKAHLCFNLAGLRAQRRKPRTTVMVTWTWIPCRSVTSCYECTARRSGRY